MNFSSDTSAPAHPRVLEALQRVNSGMEPSYGADEQTRLLKSRLADVFETDLEVLPVGSGTAANALALSVMCGPDESIICHKEAHIERDERGAPEFFTGGGKLFLLDGPSGRIEGGDLQDICSEINREFVHETPASVLSLTNLTESGTRYEAAQIAELSDIAHKAGLTVHLDGARFANALVSSGSGPADMSWKAGVDCMSLGFTKNGATGCEVIILFGALMDRFRALQSRAKRAGHLPPKMRFLSAQALVMLEDDLWLELAGRANEAARKLAGILATDAGGQIVHSVDGNEVFAHLDADLYHALLAGGLKAYPWSDGSIRFVCHWGMEASVLSELQNTVIRLIK
jgi:threonine aldolase